MDVAGATVWKGKSSESSCPRAPHHPRIFEVDLKGSPRASREERHRSWVRDRLDLPLAGFETPTTDPAVKAGPVVVLGGRPLPEARERSKRCEESHPRAAGPAVPDPRASRPPCQDSPRAERPSAGEQFETSKGSTLPASDASNPARASVAALGRSIAFFSRFVQM
jgi:hypothetical protein